MAINNFSKVSAKTPTSIGTVNVFLRATPDESGMKYSAKYEVVVLDQDGDPIRFDAQIGDLIPHLTQAQATWLIQFMADLRTKSQQEFL